MQRLVLLAGLGAVLGLTSVSVVATEILPWSQLSSLLPDAAAEAPALARVAPIETPQPVRVTTVSFVPLAVGATYTGVVRLRWDAPLAFRVAGEVLSREVEVGDRVRSGDILARLDPTDLSRARDAAQAEVAAAREELRRAETEAARSRTLLQDGHVSQSATDRALTTLAEAQGRLDRATAALDVAANQARYATLRADSDGVVTAVAAEPGQVVVAGQAAVTVARTDALDAVVALPEQLLPSLDGASVTGVLWGEEGAAPRSLTVREVAPDVEPVGRTYAVRLAFDDPLGIPFGRTVTVTLRGPDSREAAPLPLAAVVDLGEGPRVWRLRGDRVEPVPVTVAELTPNAAWVAGPLAPGDRVVSLGAHKIDPARPVRVVEIVPPPA